MGACANGARPTPGSEDLQVWIDRAQLALDVVSMLTRYAPLAYASLAASLVDINAICAENPDPPDPFTVEDILRETAAIPTGGAIGSHAVMAKAYAILRYQQFLAHCECIPPAPPSGGECPYSGNSFSIGASSSSPPVAYSISEATYASWSTLVSGSTWSFARTAVKPTGALANGELILEWSSDQVAWHQIEDLNFPNPGGAPSSCTQATNFFNNPRITQTGWVRVHNTAPSSRTVGLLSYCFCGLATTPPPLPVQPPSLPIPDVPAHDCGNDTICAQIAELAHRMSIIAGQISDIQAVITSTSVLQVLSSQLIQGEGQINLPLGVKAISIELTTLGADAYTSALGRPRGLMRVGSIRWYDGTGYSPRRFIDGDRFDDPRPVGALAVSYQLLQGTSGILKFLI